MTGPIIPADQWPEGAVALVWCAVGFSKWIIADNNAGAWVVERAGIPMPAGHDWRVPVMRQPAIDLEQFREAVELAWDHGSAARRPERDRLLAIIDGKGEGE